jgi:hypothetical protein
MHTKIYRLNSSDQDYTDFKSLRNDSMLKCNFIFGSCICLYVFHWSFVRLSNHWVAACPHVMWLTMSKSPVLFTCELVPHKYLKWCKIWGFHGGDYDDYHLLGDRATRRHLPEDDNHHLKWCLLKGNAFLVVIEIFNFILNHGWWTLTHHASVCLWHSADGMCKSAVFPFNMVTGSRLSLISTSLRWFCTGRGFLVLWSSVLWHYNVVGVHWHLGGTYCFRLQDSVIIW